MVSLEVCCRIRSSTFSNKTLGYETGRESACCPTPWLGVTFWDLWGLREEQCSIKTLMLATIWGTPTMGQPMVWAVSFNVNNIEGSITVIWQMRKLRFREVEPFIQVTQLINCRGWIWTQVCQISIPGCFHTVKPYVMWGVGILSWHLLIVSVSPSNSTSQGAGSFAHSSNICGIPALYQALGMHLRTR